jgi:hypothetical protein
MLKIKMSVQHQSDMRSKKSKDTQEWYMIQKEMLQAGNEQGPKLLN